MGRINEDKVMNCVRRLMKNHGRPNRVAVLGEDRKTLEFGSTSQCQLDDGVFYTIYIDRGEIATGVYHGDVALRMEEKQKNIVGKITFRNGPDRFHFGEVSTKTNTGVFYDIGTVNLREESFARDEHAPPDTKRPDAPNTSFETVEDLRKALEKGDFAR